MRFKFRAVRSLDHGFQALAELQHQPHGCELMASCLFIKLPGAGPEGNDILKSGFWLSMLLSKFHPRCSWKFSTARPGHGKATHTFHDPSERLQSVVDRRFDFNIFEHTSHQICCFPKNKHPDESVTEYGLNPKPGRHKAH